MQPKSRSLLLESNIIERLPVDLDDPVVDLDPAVAGDPSARLHTLDQQPLVVPRDVRARDHVDAQRAPVVAQDHEDAAKPHQEIALGSVLPSSSV